MKRILLILLPILLFILFTTITHFTLKELNRKNEFDLKTISGVTMKGDSVTIQIGEIEKLIVAFVDTSCDICTKEIEDLVKISKTKIVTVLLVSTEKYNHLDLEIVENNQNEYLYVLSISQVDANQFDFRSYPHFKFYRYGTVINEHLGRINAAKYIKDVFE